MLIEPIITEKSSILAKEGKYVFRVDKNMSKTDIKNLVQKLFGVTVVAVRTIKVHGEVKRGFSGRKKIIKPGKKAIVSLKDKEKIDLFEAKKEKKGKK